MTMNVFRSVAVATFVMAAAAPLALAADKPAGGTITGDVTPGVYGRLETVKPNLPLVYEQPMFIEPPETGGKVEPLYVHVPKEHAKNWKKYCGKYDACARPVYFVKSAEYEPGYEAAKAQATAAATGEKGEKPKRKFRSGW
jgi:hypothetical protein